ncbi:MAG: hypothetical protein Q4D21_08025 [Phascolarctobacterium sp.]|nr:hypothetical protein [Phascolarctobacterium sp.]
MFAWLESWDFIAIFMTVSSLIFMFIGQKYAQTETEKHDVFMRSLAPALAGIGYVVLHWYVATH